MSELRFIAEEIAKLRFASMDQNPHGIRDLLWSEVYKEERTVKAVQEVKELIGAKTDTMTLVEKEIAINQAWHILNSIKL